MYISHFLQNELHEFWCILTSGFRNYMIINNKFWYMTFCPWLLIGLLKDRQLTGQEMGLKAFAHTESALTWSGLGLHPKSGSDLLVHVYLVVVFWSNKKALYKCWIKSCMTFVLLDMYFKCDMIGNFLGVLHCYCIYVQCRVVQKQLPTQNPSNLKYKNGGPPTHVQGVSKV